MKKNIFFLFFNCSLNKIKIIKIIKFKVKFILIFLLNILLINQNK